MADITSIIKKLEKHDKELAPPAARKTVRSAPASGHHNRGQHLRGFGPLTRVSTSFGELPAQALRVRDLVRTRSGEFRQIKWIDRIILDEGFLRHHPRAQPIVIRAGSLGHNLPRADVMLAPFQPISLGQSFNGTSPTCAIEALGRANVLRQTETMITYTLFHVGMPASVLSEGIWIDVSP